MNGKSDDPYAPPEVELPPQQERTLAAVAHASAVFTLFIGPLIFYLTSKDKPFVRDNAREALNFSISATLAFIVLVALAIVSTLTMEFPEFILLVLYWLRLALVAASLFAVVTGAVIANSGEVYVYLVSLKLVR